MIMVTAAPCFHVSQLSENSIAICYRRRWNSPQNFFSFRFCGNFLRINDAEKKKKYSEWFSLNLKRSQRWGKWMDRGNKSNDKLGKSLRKTQMSSWFQSFFAFLTPIFCQPSEKDWTNYLNGVHFVEIIWYSFVILRKKSRKLEIENYPKSLFFLKPIIVIMLAKKLFATE